MKTGERRQELDGVRGIAILLVLVGHSDYRLAPLAAAGVALFFTLSGYLITGLLLRERSRSGRLDLRRFYTRRFTRLAPPLFVMLAVMGLLLGVSWQQLATPGLWLTNYVDIAGGGFPAFDHTWSLAVEEQFYLVWPIALLGLLRSASPAKTLGRVIALLCAWWVVLLLLGQLEYSYKALETAGVPILAGCLLAIVGTRLPTVVAPVAITGLVAFTVTLSTVDGRNLWGFAPVLSIPATVALIAAAQGATWLTWRPLTFCGVASYSIYLWHVPVAWLVGAEVGGAAGITIGALVGVLAFFVVERPLMAWRGRSANRRPASVGRLHGGVLDDPLATTRP